MNHLSAVFRPASLALSCLLLGLLALPLLALLSSSSLSDLRSGVTSPLFVSALWLSLQTTAISLVLTCICGTPLALWLARTRSRLKAGVELLVQLPVILPPAVVGVALLAAFGRGGLLAPLMALGSISLAFTKSAVVIAQVVVCSPFYVQAAANAFRSVDPDLLLVARTLGASNASAFFRITVPIALPGLLSGAALAWARALGEFGATLLFAGNSPGHTQTMPLAIFFSLESDVRVAIALSLVLAAQGTLALFLLRWLHHLWARTRGGPLVEVSEA